jgi:hypothetical protein
MRSTDPERKRVLRLLWSSAALAFVAIALSLVAVAGAHLGPGSVPKSRSQGAQEPSGATAGEEVHKGGTAGTDGVTQPTGPPTPLQPRLPLGTLRPAPVPPGVDCPAGMDCSGFSVSCPGVREDAAGVIATGTGGNPPDGVVTFFSGLGGDFWWTDKDEAAQVFLDEMRSRDLTVVQVRWMTPWLEAAPGERVGPAHLACRSATVIDWLARTIPFSHQGPGPCGFCVTGNSGGSSQISYALTRYGLDDRLDLVVPTSGPPHADIADGCAGAASSISYGSRTAVLDASLGFFDGQGPCRTGDAAWLARWRRESVEAGDLFYPHTAVRFIFGALDATRAAHHGVRYYLALRDRGSPDVTAWVVPCMGHRVQAWTAGLDTLRVALTEPVVPGPVAPPVAEDEDCPVPTPQKTFSIPPMPGTQGQP